MKTKIVVTYSGPKGLRGARMVAKCNGKQLSVPYDHSLSTDARYLDAARAFANKHGIRGEVVCDEAESHYRADGYVFKVLDQPAPGNTHFTREGRGILRDGKPFVYVDKSTGGASPVEADCVAVLLTRYLNSIDFEKALADYRKA